MNNIELNNYRCFEKLLLIFSDKVNLLIGDNASGKTTIIRALSAVLNSFFSGFSDENTRFWGLSKNDFRIIEHDSVLANELPIKIDFVLLNVVASLELHSKKGRTLQKPLDPIYRLGKELYDNLFVDGVQKKALPLFANFSTSDIHSNRKLSVEKFKKYDHKPSFGYYECLQGDGFLDYWTKRLLVLQEASRGELEIEGVRKAIRDALGPDGCNVIRDLQIRHNQGKVYYILSDGRESQTDNLSDGLTRLINIILDLSFRCMLLNKGIYGIDACKKTKGTVLIDEMDLHLHPTLQSVVIKGIQNAFPNLQWIITSHAPMIMTGIPMDQKNKIYKLGYNSTDGYTAKEIDSYGLDASTIIEAIIGITPRAKEVDERLKILFNLIDNDNYKLATKHLVEMKKQFGDALPELSKAEAMINFLREDNDKN